MKKTVLFMAILSVIRTCGQDEPGRMELHLSVNGKSSLELQQGFPLEIRISVTNPAARQAAMAKIVVGTDSLTDNRSKTEMLDNLAKGYLFGSIDKPWFNQVSLMMGAGNRSFTLSSELLHPVPEKTVTMNDENVAIVFFGVDPDKTLDLHADTYTLRAFIIASREKDQGDTLWSDTNILTIKTPPLTDYHTLNASSLHFLAGYWLKRGNCDKAEEIVNILSDKHSDSPATWTLKAEVFECLGDDQQALEFYQKALLQYDRGALYEPPEFLWEKIQELQEKRLEQKKE